MMAVWPSVVETLILCSLCVWIKKKSIMSDNLKIIFYIHDDSYSDDDEELGKY